MTKNQLAENSVNQLLNSVRLARDNAERADNRVDHSFYFALTIALEELQERRKAAMDSEPVAWTWHHLKQWHVTNDEERARDLAWDGVKVEPLYRHAQPVPVVLKDHQIRELVNQLRDIAIEYHGTQQLRERIARVLRAAMLQAEPVTTANKLGTYPVIPDGWKLVPVEPNGDMLAAAQDAYGETDGDIASTLRAAIAAAAGVKAERKK